MTENETTCFSSSSVEGFLSFLRQTVNGNEVQVGAEAGTEETLEHTQCRFSLRNRSIPSFGFVASFQHHNEFEFLILNVAEIVCL